MTTAMMVVAAVALPWLAGALLVSAMLARFGERDRWIAIGYGHFAGILMLMALLRGFDLAGLGLSFAPIAAVLALIAAAGAWMAWRRRPPPAADAHAPTGASGTALRVLAVVALALVAIRIGALAIEVVLRPLLPWDAWSQWATKAKVWSALRELAPFIAYDDWIARKPGYTDTAPHYPATIPLLQTWIALAIGRWDDALINVPWLAAFVALGAGVFAQLRRLGIDGAGSIVATYLALSLPLLDVHVALAGYADLHVAAAYALGILALAEWETKRAPSTMVLLALCGLLLPMLKVPGIAWLGTLALGTALAVLGTSWLRVAAAFLVIGGATVAVGLFMTADRMTVPTASGQAEVAASLVEQLFAFGSWNLLWYLVPLAMIAGWRTAIAYRGTLLALATGFGFLAWTFFFTKAAEWVVDYTTVNRALLHIAPAVTAFAALIVLRPVRSATSVAAA